MAPLIADLDTNNEGTVYTLSSRWKPPGPQQTLTIPTLCIATILSFHVHLDGEVLLSAHDEIQQGVTLTTVRLLLPLAVATH
jgi:hypothetical protein